MIPSLSAENPGRGDRILSETGTPRPPLNRLRLAKLRRANREPRRRAPRPAPRIPHPEPVIFHPGGRYTLGDQMEAHGNTAASDTRDLFREHGGAVYRFALVLVRHHQDAEDVVQETFMKLLQHLSSGGNTANLRGWLFTVAAHAARDRQRRRMRWLPWTTRAEPAVDPAALPDEDGRYKALREALRGLSHRDRLLLALRAQGLTYREIAAAADIRESSVEPTPRACDRAVEQRHGGIQNRGRL